MRKDSAFIFGFSVLITAGIVGGAYYMNVVRPSQPSEHLPKPTISSSRVVGNSIDPGAARPHWTDKPIKCIDEEIGEFWTNASNCEDADLNNRLSIAEPIREVDYISPNAKEARREIHSSARRNASREPSLRRVAKAVPSNLSVSCKFAAGRALEIERMLSTADDPRESIWRKNYCRWVNDARSRGCKLERNFFFYGDLCGYGLRAAN